MIPSVQAWFAGGERVGYNPKACNMVAAEDGPLRIFLRWEGDLARAVSFLPGFPDGSFGWAKVWPHLPNAAEMPKLFLDYVGMGDRQAQGLRLFHGRAHRPCRSDLAGFICPVHDAGRLRLFVACRSRVPHRSPARQRVLMLI